MKIKYLLSGRLLSDINHLRKLIDTWPENIEFPNIVNDLKQIKDDDIVLTYGYLGLSSLLIKKHNPYRTFIFDNPLYPTKGISNFRLLDGNLITLLKKEETNNFFQNYYKNQLEKSLRNLNSKNTNSEFKDIDIMQNMVLEFPWSIPIKRIINFKDKKSIENFNYELNNLKLDNFFQYFKDGAIKSMTNDGVPFSRIYNRNFQIMNHIRNSSYVICPTSTLALQAILIKKKLFVSNYNPFYKYLIENRNYLAYSKDNIINSLSQYLSRINFSISDLFNLIKK